MTTLREQLAAKTAEYDTLEAKVVKANEQQWAVEEARTELRKAILLDKIDYLLGWYRWSPTIHYKGNLILAATWNPEDSEERNARFEALCLLCDAGYHDTFTIEKGVNLSFDDGDLGLFFDTGEIAVAFLKRTGLVARVNTEALQEVATKARAQAEQAAASADKVDDILAELLG